MTAETAASGEESTTTLSTAPLATSAGLLAFGILAIAVAASFYLIPRAMNATPSMNFRVFIGMIVVGGAMFLWAIARLPAQVSALENAAPRSEPARSTELYGLYLVGIGFALLLQALVCSIVFTAVSHSVGQGGTVTQSATVATASAFEKFFGKKEDALFITGLFGLSSMGAMLGALFFFANSMWQKMAEPERTPFDRRFFWGGLWFRLGEAILFNLVFFLVLRSYAPERFLLLPLVSLLVGMFLKTGETLVSGIATRVFAAIQALVPTDLGAQKVMKLLTGKLDGFPADATEEVVGKRLDELVPVIKALPGVDQIEKDAKARTIRIEYNASAVTPDEIKRKIELKGLKLL